jgi:hypothetical protein
VPNPAFERTAASALCLLAVSSSLHFAAATQRERQATSSVVDIRHRLDAPIDGGSSAGVCNRFSSCSAFPGPLAHPDQMFELP